MQDIQETKYSEQNDIFDCVDKLHNPYLMAASFQGLVKFNGSFIKDAILHWQFSPSGKALELIDQLESKTEPRIPILDFANATDKFWKNVDDVRKSTRKELDNL